MVWRPRNPRNERIMSASYQVSTSTDLQNVFRLVDSIGDSDADGFRVQIISQGAPDEVADAMWRYIGVAMGEPEKGSAPIRSKL